MSAVQILLVEDETSIADAIALNLRLEGYQVLIASTGNEALAKFKSAGDDLNLVLLDIMLPDHDGFYLCEQFKNARPELPVIFLSARDHPVDKRSGLKLGADDYITKPFDLEEVLLRIQNVIRRTYKKLPASFRFDDMEVNFDTFEIVDINGAKHTLSRREIGLLQLLVNNKHRVVSRDEIIESLWEPEENPSARTIDNYILNFRKYFERQPKEPRYFHSIRGVGYKFTP